MTRIQPGLTKGETDHLFHLAGTFFLTIQLITFSTLIFDVGSRPFLFWMCNNFSLFLALACYLKNMQLIKGISYAGLIPQLLWIIDFSASLFGFHPMGITSYIAREGFTYANNVSIVLHMCVPIMILVLSFRTRPQLSSVLYAIPYIGMLFILTYFFTPSQEDINCVFVACHLDTFLPYSISLWPLYVFLVALCGYIMHHLLYYGWEKYRDNRELILNSMSLKS